MPSPSLFYSPNVFASKSLYWSLTNSSSHTQTPSSYTSLSSHLIFPHITKLITVFKKRRRKMSLTQLIFNYVLVFLILSGSASSQKLAKDEGIHILKWVHVTYVRMYSPLVTGIMMLVFCVAVDVLRAVAKGLHQNNWDFTVDPCDVASTVGGWRTPYTDKNFENNVTCNCSSSVCHVTNMCVPLSLFVPF